MALIWGTNYSIIKHAFREIDPQAFNAARMVTASVVFLALIFGIRRFGTRSHEGSAPGGDAGIASIFYTPERVTGRDWLWLVALGTVGHFLYQYFFIAGLAQTSVANSSLMLAATPVLIALITALFGRERISPLHWAGAALSTLGIYLVVGAGATLGGETLTGDLFMVVAVTCWAAYTLAARKLITRHSPVGVTGISMIIGTLLYVPTVHAHLRTTAWNQVGAGTWTAIVYSALFALCISYTIWYAAVREIGSARTAVYSNLVPIVAMVTAILTLGEPLSASKIAGAAAVLVGVALTRAGRSQVPIPPEE